MKDSSFKSHLRFNMVFNVSYFNQYNWFSNWWNNGLLTYVKINTPEEAANINAQLPGFMDKYFGDDFAESGKRVDLALEPLSEIYFNKDTRYDMVRHGNINTIYTLGLVAMAILFIACFNYVNLTIAQSFKRAKEIAVRKMLGAHKQRLILQLLGESFTILIFSCLLAIGLSTLLNPIFNNYFQLDIVLNWLDLNVVKFFSILFLTTLVIAGLYPAIQLTSFSTLSILKGGKLNPGKSGLIRKGLVTTQFVISIFMIASAVLISMQMEFINNKDLGFNKDAIVMVDINNQSIRNNIESFENSFENETNIQSVSTVSGEPGGFLF